MPLPRRLFTLSLLWALAAFIASVGTQAPIQPTAGAYLPGVRGMLALLAVGLCLLWPIARLTLAAPPWPPARVALDALVLASLLQGAFWPMHLVTPWALDRAAAIDLLLVGWTAAAGAVVALGLRDAHPSRWALALLAVIAAGPVLDAVGAPPPWPALAGPFPALGILAPAESATRVAPEWQVAAWPWVVAAALWAVALRRAPGRADGCPRGAGAVP